MTKLAIGINLDRCIGCHTCANACKMQNNVPDGMLWNRVITEGCDAIDGAVGEYPNLNAHLCAPGVPALREPGLPEGVPDRRHLQGRAGPRGDRLRPSASAAACAWPPAPSTPACSTGNDPVSVTRDFNCGDARVPVRTQRRDGEVHAVQGAHRRRRRAHVRACAARRTPACSAIWTTRTRSWRSCAPRRARTCIFCWKRRARSPKSSTSTSKGVPL